jgi:hypothetical protein
MTRVLESQFLTPVELDFLWEELRAGELPFPLTLQSHGETMGERSMLRRDTMTQLAARQLVSMTGRIDAELADLLLVLARPDVAVDALFLPEDDSTEAVTAFAGRAGSLAVVAVQDQRGLELRPVRVDSMVNEMVGIIPAGRRGTEVSVSLPAEEFNVRTVRRSGGTDSDQHARAVAYRLLTDRNVRYGEFAVSGRDQVRGTSLRTPVLAWSDKSSGRYISYVRGGWRTIAPADAGMLRQRLIEMMRDVERLTAG